MIISQLQLCIKGHRHKTFFKIVSSNIYIFQEIAFNLVILGLFTGVNNIIVLTLVYGLLICLFFKLEKSEI